MFAVEAVSDWGGKPTRFLHRRVAESRNGTDHRRRRLKRWNIASLEAFAPQNVGCGLEVDAQQIDDEINGAAAPFFCPGVKELWSCQKQFKLDALNGGVPTRGGAILDWLEGRIPLGMIGERCERRGRIQCPPSAQFPRINPWHVASISGYSSFIERRLLDDLSGRVRQNRRG